MGSDRIVEEINTALATRNSRHEMGDMAHTNPQTKTPANCTARDQQRGAILMATGDMHEHLGQLIAYARANQIVPPWSR